MLTIIVMLMIIGLVLSGILFVFGVRLFASDYPKIGMLLYSTGIGLFVGILGGILGVMIT